MPPFSFYKAGLIDSRLLSQTVCACSHSSARLGTRSARLFAFGKSTHGAFARCSRLRLEFLRAKRSSELRQPFGLKCFKLRQKQFKPEARTPSEGEGEVWRRSRHPEGETFSAENASTIRQFCYAKLPGGRDGPREGVRVKQGIALNTNTLCT